MEDDLKRSTHMVSTTAGQAGNFQNYLTNNEKIDDP
jgi:hypothetical protein